jgi:hypothetical protein
MTRGASTKNANNDDTTVKAKKAKAPHRNAGQRRKAREASGCEPKPTGTSQKLCLGSMKGILICKTTAVQGKMEAAAEGEASSEVPVKVRRLMSRRRDRKLKMAEELCSALDEQNARSSRKHSSKCQAWPSSDIVFYQKHWTHLSAPGGSCKGATRSWRRTSRSFGRLSFGRLPFGRLPFAIRIRKQIWSPFAIRIRKQIWSPARLRDTIHQ